jgi:hypothetical protein
MALTQPLDGYEVKTEMLKATGKLVVASLALIITGNNAAVAQDKVAEWFQKYDNIRHQAQMSPQEKERSSALLTTGMAASLFKSEQGEKDKAAASALLRKMVDRYRKASTQLGEVPEIGETKKLQRGYLQYFRSAGDLFSDYLKIQNNLFATDSSGNSLVGQLQQRKADLEALDQTNKELDGKLRTKFKIAPYAW